MKRGHVWGIILVLAGGALAGSYIYKKTALPGGEETPMVPLERKYRTVPPAPANLVDPATSEPYFISDTVTETSFFTKYMLTDMAQMVFIATQHRLPRPDEITVRVMELDTSTSNHLFYQAEVTIAGEQRTIKYDVDGKNSSFWSPSAYQGAMKDFFAKIPKGADPAGLEPTGEFIKRIADLDVAGIEKENVALSKALEANFLSPELHSRAALLLGTLAMHQNAGYFYDVRPELSRMATHLAMALAVSHGGFPDQSTSKLADVLRITLQGNEQEALAILESPQYTDEPWKTWEMSLRLRLTSDYRRIGTRQPTSYLEKCEQFRAWATAVSSEHAMAVMKVGYSIKDPRLISIISLDDNPIEVDHVVHNELFRGIVGELNAVAPTAFPKSEEGKRPYKEFMNLDPDLIVGTADGREQLHIIGPGIWSIYFQNALCQAAIDSVFFVKHGLGFREDAREEFDDYRAKLAGLPQNDLIGLPLADGVEEYHEEVHKFIKVCRTRPQQVPAACWTWLSGPPWVSPIKETYFPLNHQHSNEWFHFNPPVGTAYDVSSRNYYPSFIGWNQKGVADDLTQYYHEVRKLAPSNTTLNGLALNHHFPNPPIPRVDFEKESGPLLDYHVAWLLSKCTRLPAKDAVDYLKRFAPRFPDAALQLAGNESLAGELKTNERIYYAESALTLGQSVVSLSEVANFVINYYIDSGRPDDARRWADVGEQAGSELGMKAALNFYKRIGDTKGELAMGFSLGQRYGNIGPVISTLRRLQESGNHTYDEVLERLGGKLFPGGMKLVKLSDFQGQPEGGIALVGRSPLLTEAGLQDRDLVVAANGIAVRTVPQYEFARDSTSPNPFTLIVWRSGKFFEVTANPPNRLFNVTLVSHTFPKP